MIVRFGQLAALSPSALALAMSPAGAMPPATIATDGRALYVGGVVALAVLAVALWGWWRARAKINRLEADLAVATDRLSHQQATLEALPDSLAEIGSDGLVLPDGLAQDLGLETGRLDGLAGLASCMEPTGLTALATATDAWRQGEAPPHCLLETTNGARTLEVLGLAGPGDGGAHRLYFRDVTEMARRLKAAERQVRNSAHERARLARILDSLPFSVWERAEDLKIVWCNAAYARTLAVEAAEVLSGNNMEIETAMIAGRARAFAQEARQAGQALAEIRHFVVDGERRALSITEGSREADGSSIGFGRDETEREEREAEFRRFLSVNTEVMNNLNAAIAIFDPHQRLNFFNSAFARLWRLDEDWLGGDRSHGELIDAIRDNRLLPEQADYLAYKNEVLSLYTNLLETDESYDYLPDGRTLRTVVSPHPLGGLLVVHEDVTDRLRLERSYNTLIATQQASLANLYEAVAVFGSDGRLKLYNPSFATFWHLDEAMLDDEPHVSELIDAAIAAFDGYEFALENRDLVIARTTERHAGTGRIELPDGKIFDYASIPLPDGNLLFTYLDVTDSTTIERVLRERNEALETADRLKTEFIANMSYELRSPLNVIIGFAEILDNEYFGDMNDKQQEYCRGILASSQQLLALINDILDLASIEAGQLELDAEPIEVEQLLSNVIGLAREWARKQQVSLQIDCPADIGEINGDERRVKQVLFNLLSNAIKYSGEGSSVTIGATAEAGDVLLWVQDSGVGTEAEELDLVFNRFQRGEQQAQTRGAGLGLAVVKSFVELHGGVVELHSDIDRGTRVTARLPRDSATAAPLAGNS